MPKILRRIAYFSVGVPASVAAIAFAILDLRQPLCAPQTGVGECLSLGFVLAYAMYGAFFLTLAGLFFIAPLLLLAAWWLDSRSPGRERGG